MQILLEEQGNDEHGIRWSVMAVPGPTQRQPGPAQLAMIFMDVARDMMGHALAEEGLAQEPSRIHLPPGSGI